MLQLILFRHAEAERPVGLNDHERPLSETGLQQARKMGEHIAAQALAPDLAIVSSAKRTRQTWDAACDAGNLAVPHVIESDIYEASPDDLVNILTRQSSRHKTIIMVGHNPGMGQLTIWLSGSSDETALANLQQHGFTTGGMAVLQLDVADWSSLNAHCGTLKRFETPETV